MRQTKYHPNYGYVVHDTTRTGGSLSDVFNIFTRAIPDALKPALKQVAKRVVKSGATAVGDRIGSELASRIAPKKTLAPNLDIALRKEILNDLKLDGPPDISKLGFGTTKIKQKKMRGGGIKILK
jgi:hypothetical protein